jgi:EAL domain-containing protein (putative c-di-GMP-specific phosphodiesterase class I)
VAVAVNLSGLLPGDPEFRATVTDIVESSGLPWERLVLEVVETSLVALPAHALAAMERLVACGARFAIDDFGTGYSSLARLKELPAQIVKVDRAFVRGVATDPADFAVARAVVDMAKAMGRCTVAEGVETTDQYHVLRGVGVEAHQGWLFARSLPPWQLRDLLAGGRVAVPPSATGS